MRLTVLIVALSLVIIVAEPAVMMKDYPESPPAEGYSVPEEHQPASEVSTGEQRSSSSVYGISEEYQSISKEYTMPEAQMPAYKDQGISIKSQSLSIGYALPEKNAVPEEIPSLSGPVSEALPLTAQRAQSGAPGALVGTILFALIFFLPALLIATLLICTAALLIFLSPFGILSSLILGLFFSIPGAMILGPLFFIAIFIIALVSGVGVVASPLFTAILLGAGVFLCASPTISAFACFVSECFALLCGGNVVSLCASLLFQFVHIAVTWVSFSGGGFGPGMLLYLIINMPLALLLTCISTICSIIPPLGWIGNAIFRFFCFSCSELEVWCLSLCFDICWFEVMPLISIVSSLGGISSVIGIIGIFTTGISSILTMLLGCGWILCNDCLILPIESCAIYILNLCAQCCAVPLGWIAQCVPVAPSVSVVIGLFSGLALALVAVVLGFVLSPFLGWLIGPLALAVIGGATGAVFGLLMGPFIPILLVLILMAAGVAIVIATWLALASYLAEATGTSGAFLSMVRRAGIAFTVFGRFVLELGRSLMSLARGILVPAIRFFDGCLGTCRYYDDMANLLFVLCYTVLATCASTGILSCCVGPCLTVPCILCNFCARLSWDFTYSLTDSLRSITSSALVLFETGDLGLMSLIYQNVYVFLDFVITSFGHCTDLVAVLVNVWGVIAAGITAVMALVSECATLCSSIDFIAGMPSFLISLIEDLPMRICAILQSCGFLFLALSGFIIDALSRMRDRFPAPGEAL
jgi:hypothetical protein